MKLNSIFLSIMSILLMHKNLAVAQDARIVNQLDTIYVYGKEISDLRTNEEIFTKDDIDKNKSCCASYYA